MSSSKSKTSDSEDEIKPGNGAGMVKTLSSPALGCEQPTGLVSGKEEPSSVLTLGLVLPTLLVLAFLVVLKKMSEDLYKEAEEADLGGEKFSGSFPIRQVWISAPIFFSVLYPLVVFGGQYVMKSRAPFQITSYVFVYNVYQCLLNLWTVIEMIREVTGNGHFKEGIWGNIPQTGLGGFRISWLVWVHYNNKFIELLDTLWMILKKKNDQISFLHCYHHMLLIWVWWYCCSLQPGGDSWFGACVNSFIHVIMYGYYTVALLKINIPKPFKIMITNCQMVQFTVCLSHSAYVYYKGNMPRELPLTQAFVMINMLILFGMFYVQKYIGGGESGKGKGKGKGGSSKKE